MILLLCGLLMSIAVFSQTPTAQQIAANMGVAWNLGNTLEPSCGEGCWAPAATPELIDAVAAAGFKTIRIPVAWDSHANSSNQIDPNWLARVKQVVDYCYANNLYVIINNHWDNGWFDGNGFNNFNSTINDKMQAYWTQIANTFVNYDSHLLFCAANEPDVQSASQTDVLLQYYQTFVDAVRATGGQNATRCLVLPGPSTNIDKTNDWMNTLPTDPTPDRLMIDVHYYSPFQFVLMTEDATWGNMFYYWGQGYHSTANPDRNSTWGEESYVDSQLDLMQTKFVNNGVPVIIGEFGVIKRENIPELSLHLASREYWHSYVNQAALNRGMVPMYWDNGWAGENGFALFDRITAEVVDQGTVNVLMGGEPTPPPGGGGDPTSVHVQSIVTGTQSAEKGNKLGTATVTIYNDLGNAVSGATVTGTFSGTFNETVSGTTGSNGTVTLVTNGTAKGNVTVNLCVDNVMHSSLTYAPAQNAITCTGAGARFSSNQTGARSSEKEDQINFEIYPNPAAQGKFTVALPEVSGTATISIFDGQGKLLYQKYMDGNKKLELDQRLSTGIYLIKVSSGKLDITKKLIVN